MLGIVVISVSRVFSLREPSTEGGVFYKFIIQRLEIACSGESQRLCDFLAERVAKRHAGDPGKGELCKRYASAGISVLFSVGPYPAQSGSISLSVQHVLKRERFVIRAVSREAVKVVARRVAQQR